MVFDGIAGVVSSEQGDSDDPISGPLPSLSAKSSEVSDMQDLYRRTLAASWNSRSTDLPADKLIEDLFSGGAGYNNGIQSQRMSRLDDSLNVVSAENGANQRESPAGNRLSPSFERRPKSSSSNEVKAPELLSSIGNMGNGNGNGRRGGSIEQQIFDNSKAKGLRSRAMANEHEVSEFDVREDLRSWEISPKE